MVKENLNEIIGGITYHYVKIINDVNEIFIQKFKSTKLFQKQTFIVQHNT